jgi:subtilisin family serine protease
VIASAGNWGTGVDAGTWLVSSPGTSWNVLTVGGVNDGTGRLWYDGSCPCSGALWDEDPDWPFNPHGDFNKPNVSAPAVNVETANGKRASGTSIAAPIVAGIAAQLYARNPTTFRAWPEAMRAIIMASAHRRIPLSGGGTSTDHEGVGTVHALWAHRVYGNPTYGGWTKGTMAKGERVSKTFSVKAGQKVRIALAWDSHTTGTMFDRTNRLQADLDLVVTYPGGTKKSLSYDNANEFVSFQAPSSGTVTVRIAQSRFDGDSEHWALAWLRW